MTTYLKHRNYSETTANCLLDASYFSEFWVTQSCVSDMCPLTASKSGRSALTHTPADCVLFFSPRDLGQYLEDPRFLVCGALSQLGHSERSFDACSKRERWKQRMLEAGEPFCMAPTLIGSTLLSMCPGPQNDNHQEWPLTGKEWTWGMYQGWSTDGHECSTLVGAAIPGRLCMCRGWGYTGAFTYLAPDVAVDLKLL